jgi:WD40 repeat protein
MSKKATVIICAAAIAIVAFMSLKIDAAAPSGPAFAGKLVATLPGHVGYINSISISPDGKTIASVSLDGVKIWDVATRKLVKSFIGHKDGVYSVSYSRDGKFLATGGCEIYSEEENCVDGGWKLWDARDFSEIRGVNGVKFGVEELAFNPAGDLLATTTQTARDPVIRIWDVSSGELLKILDPGMQRLTTGVVFTPDGSKLITATHNVISIWDPLTGENLRKIEGHQYRIASIALSPDGRLLASGTGVKNEIKVWDSDFKELLTLTGHNDDAASLSFSFDGKLLASGSYDKTIKIWNTASGRLIKSIFAHKYIVKSVEFSPVENLLVSGGCERHIQGDCKQGLIKLWK